MNFLNRLKFYLIGLGLGLLLIYSLFKDREWDWLPENKVKKFILETPLKINLKKDQTAILTDQFSKKIFDLIINGNVNFSESKTKFTNKKYVIEYKNSSALFNISFEDTLCRIISIDNMIFKDIYGLGFLDTIVFIDHSNLYLKFEKMEKKFTKNFISKVEKYGLNPDDISKIDAIVEETAKELISRSKETLIKEKEAVAMKLKELGVEDKLISLKGMTQGMLVILGQKNIKKLTDFADLSSDELIGGFDEIKGKKIRIDGYLEEFSLSRKEADDLIMAAREIAYK